MTSERDSDESPATCGETSSQMSNPDYHYPIIRPFIGASITWSHRCRSMTTEYSAADPVKSYDMEPKWHMRIT